MQEKYLDHHLQIYWLVVLSRLSLLTVVSNESRPEICSNGIVTQKE